MTNLRRLHRRSNQRPSRKDLLGMSPSEFKTFLKYTLRHTVPKDLFYWERVTLYRNRLYRWRLQSEDKYVDVSCPLKDFDRWSNSIQYTIPLNPPSPFLPPFLLKSYLKNLLKILSYLNQHLGVLNTKEEFTSSISNLLTGLPPQEHNSDLKVDSHDPSKLLYSLTTVPSALQVFVQKPPSPKNTGYDS